MKAHPPFTCQASRPFSSPSKRWLRNHCRWSFWLGTLYKINFLQKSESLGLNTSRDAGACFTGNQKMSPGFPVQGSCHTGCNTGSTGSDSGSTVATAEHTEERNKMIIIMAFTALFSAHLTMIFEWLEQFRLLKVGERPVRTFKLSQHKWSSLLKCDT